MIYPFLVAIALASARGGTPAPSDGPGSITVTAESELKFPPNEATVTMTVTNADRDLNAAKRNNDERARRVLAALTAAGVDPRHLQTTGATVTPNYRYREDRDPELIGYTASKTITACIKDLARVDEATTAALRAGAVGLSPVQLKNTELPKFEAEARVAAVKAAQARAAAMVEALGQKLGRPRLVSELPSSVVAGSASGYSGGGGAAVGGSSFAGGELGVISRVQVQFEIADSQ